MCCGAPPYPIELHVPRTTQAWTSAWISLLEGYLLSISGINILPVSFSYRSLMPSSIDKARYRIDGYSTR